MVARHARLSQCLHRLSQTVSTATDAELLGQYEQLRDEAAFASLVRRHGSMVLAVCQRIVGDRHAAEDAFQATFFALARRPGAIRRPEALTAWLYGTARRIALKARRAGGRRCVAPLPTDADAPADPRPDPLRQLTAREVLMVLDEEVACLPEMQQLAIVLCCLEGKTLEEAADQLGWTIGSVKGRLERGRRRLHARLVRRGIVSVTALTILEVSRPAATARMSPAQVMTTTRAAVKFAGIATLDGNVASVPAKLATEILCGPGAINMKSILAIAAFLGVGALGIGALTQPAAPANGELKQVRAATPESHEPVQPGATDNDGDALPAGALVRLGTARLRHANGTVIAFAGDKTAISIGGDRKFRFWNVNNGRLAKTLPGPQWEWRCPPAVSPNGATLAVFDWHPNRLTLWDVQTGKELRRIAWDESTMPLALAFAANGQALAAAHDKALHVFDATTGKRRIPALLHDSYIEHVAFAPGGKYAATTTRQEFIHIWEAATWQEVRKIRAPGDSLAFAPDGSTVAVVDREHGVSLWDAATGAARGHVPVPPPAGELYSHPCLAFSPDGKLLAAGGSYQPVVVWDIAAGKSVRKEWGLARQDAAPVPILSERFKERHRLPVGLATGLVFASSNKVLATSVHGAICLWDLTSGKELHPRDGHTGEVTVLAVAPDGKTAASGSNQDGTVRIWDVTSGRQRHVLTGHNSFIDAIDFDPRGRTVASGGGDGTLRIWDLTSGKCVRIAAIADAPHWKYMRSVRYSADSKMVIAIGEVDLEGGGSRHEVWTWEAATDAWLRKRTLAPRTQPRMLSSDGTRLVVEAGKMNGHTIEDVMTGATKGEVHDAGFGPLALAPDGYTVAFMHVVGQDVSKGVEGVSAVDVWDFRGRRRICSLDAGAMASAAFSPDQRYLATAARERLQLWEMRTGREVMRIQRPEEYVGWAGSFASSLMFTADGRNVITGLPDTTILVWSLDANLRGKAATVPNLEQCWSDLASDDAVRAFRALHTLACGSRVKVLAFLAGQLKRIASPDEKQVRRLIADLDSDEFATRESAQDALVRLGIVIEPIIQDTFKGNPPLETRRRLEQVLQRAGRKRTPDELRSLRAVECLELIGSPEAQRLLQSLSRGAAGASQTREAQGSLSRLVKRSGIVP